MDIYYQIITNLTNHIILSIIFLCFIAWLSVKLKFYSYYLFTLILSFTVAVLMTSNPVMYFFVFVLGMLTAFAELIGRYDEPIKTLRSWPALVFHIINGLIAIFALKLLFLYGATNSEGMDQIKNVLTAGLGSTLIMRSKLFSIKNKEGKKGEEIAVGPEQIMKIYLDFVSELINRDRTLARINFVKDNCDTLIKYDFKKASQFFIEMLSASQNNGADTYLKEHILALKTDTFSLGEEQKATPLGEEQKATPLSEEQKATRLLFLLLDKMGEDFISTVLIKMPYDYKTEKACLDEHEERKKGLTGLLDKKASLLSEIVFGAKPSNPWITEYRSVKDDIIVKNPELKDLHLALVAFKVTHKDVIESIIPIFKVINPSGELILGDVPQIKFGEPNSVSESTLLEKEGYIITNVNFWRGYYFGRDEVTQIEVIWQKLTTNGIDPNTKTTSEKLGTGKYATNIQEKEFHTKSGSYFCDLSLSVSKHTSGEIFLNDIIDIKQEKLPKSGVAMSE